MHTIIPADLNLLDDYADFHEINQNWSILSYLNMKYDINSAIAFSKLFFPDFVVKDNCVILSFLFNSEIFEDWYSQMNGDISSIEKMCNLYEINDLFHINPTGANRNSIIELSRILKNAWELNLLNLFPERQMRVIIFDQYNSTFITLYTVSDWILATDGIKSVIRSSRCSAGHLEVQ